MTARKLKTTGKIGRFASTIGELVSHRVWLEKHFRKKKLKGQLVKKLGVKGQLLKGRKK